MLGPKANEENRALSSRVITSYTVKCEIILFIQVIIGASGVFVCFLRN